ncbi:hypothetical protein B9Z19DRAFT_1076275 [Tuber borchii]|uniref:Uncharacterized protein n=1 Tax=Tuber borchii TaxID=42251 RepID=A0A2T7A277_TUBBO|nr:hypothetical protein B9Z19DRAFT_1076275 [Tuber borchii]
MGLDVGLPLSYFLTFRGGFFFLFSFQFLFADRINIIIIILLCFGLVNFCLLLGYDRAVLPHQPNVRFLTQVYTYHTVVILCSTN